MNRSVADRALCEALEELLREALQVCSPLRRCPCHFLRSNRLIAFDFAPEHACLNAFSRSARFSSIQLARSPSHIRSLEAARALGFPYASPVAHDLRARLPLEQTGATVGPATPLPCESSCRQAHRRDVDELRFEPRIAARPGVFLTDQSSSSVFTARPFIIAHAVFYVCLETDAAVVIVCCRGE